jgi:hypothetical protein
VLDADQVATALRGYMDGLPDDLEVQAPRFTGTAGDLLKALNNVVPESQQKAKGWPKRPNDLGTRLRRIAPPLRKIGIDIVFPQRAARERKIIITARPVKDGKTSSSSSSLSFSRDANDLEETACCHRVVTDVDAVVTSDGSSDNSDDSDDNSKEAVVTANQLKNNGNDNSDNSDNNLPALTGDHVCAHCGHIGGDLGGVGQMWTIAGRDVWLHAGDCEAAYYDAHADDPPPWEPPGDRPPEEAPPW